MNDQQQLYHNGKQVNILYRWVRDSHSLEKIPELVKRIIREEMWKQHLFEKTGEVFQFENFQAFVETHPPDGLGTTIENIWHLCREDQEAQDLIDQATQRKVGAPKGSQNAKKNREINLYNVQDKNKAPTGNTKQAGLRKLRKYAEIHQEFEKFYQMALAGDMSVNMALIKTGLRSKALTIPSDPERASRILKKHFTNEEIEDLIWYLEHEAS